MTPSFDHVIILADESANWKIAGLRQLERLVLALDELATSISSQRKIDIFFMVEHQTSVNAAEGASMCKCTASVG